MTRLTTYLFLATLLIAWPVNAQEESIDWTHLPWGSSHTTFLAPFGSPVVEYQFSSEMQEYLSKKNEFTHYRVPAVEFAGVEFEIYFYEDLSSHRLARIELQWETRTGDWAAQEKVVTTATTKLTKLFGSPADTREGTPHQSTYWSAGTTRATLSVFKNQNINSGRVYIRFSPSN